MDGIDLGEVAFSEETKARKPWRMEGFRHFPFPDGLAERLAEAPQLHTLALLRLERDYTLAVARAVNDYLAVRPAGAALPEGIGFHGQTVYHAPEAGLSYAIGDAAALAVRCGLPVVADFRRADLAAGGQGAPLVPMVDEHLFAAYDACLNLGGIANLSWREGDTRRAADLVPCNVLLNALAQKAGATYDRNGMLSRDGHPDDRLLAAWDAHPFYRRAAPKSLDRGFAAAELLPQLDPPQAKLSVADALQTAQAHIAGQVAAWVARIGLDAPGTRVLVTGGGAHHPGLLACLRQASRCRWEVPAPELVDGKEALAFAYLAMRRFYGRANVLASATGAGQTVCAGALHLPAPLP
jgi:anhydro-N-acetylmuramic acid kinase